MHIPMSSNQGHLHSSPLPFKQYMETRKALASIDELTMVKAAAWAWYQRGSGSDGRPVREFYLTPASRAPTPSRYKLEAMKEAQEREAMDGSKSNSPSPTPSLSHSDSSLFDMYEIERISQQLDYYIKASQAEYYGRYFSGDRRTVPLSESEMSGMKGKEKKKKTKRFLLRHAVTCGSRDDVVDSIGFGGPRSPEKHAPRLPEKHVPVVRLDNCRPRATHA